MVKQSTSVTREPTNCKALKPTVTNRKKKKKRCLEVMVQQ